MRVLVVADPWIGLILSGDKTWEMRTRPTRVRGTVGLVRKGSGLVVGTVRIVGSGTPLTGDGYAAGEPFHRIPPEARAAAVAGGWLYPWLLEGAAALARPVPYVHPRGAVTWVVLPDDVAARVVAGAVNGRSIQAVL